MNAPDPLLDYPLGERRPSSSPPPRVRRSRRSRWRACARARIAPAELRATPETLRRQAAVARAAGREQLAENLERAAELAALPDDEVLAVYTALRPRRATAAELEAMAQQLAAVAAPRCAAFVREAADVMAERGLLRTSA